MLPRIDIDDTRITVTDSRGNEMSIDLAEVGSIAVSTTALDGKITTFVEIEHECGELMTLDSAMEGWAVAIEALPVLFAIPADVWSPALAVEPTDDLEPGIPVRLSPVLEVYRR
jgi:hypothetical protein